MASDVFRIVGTTVVGAFHVEAVVAEGGFAVVYRAYHAGFRAPVALKCLKIPVHLSASAQQRFAEQFHAEAELLFKLSASIPTVVRPLHVEAVVAPDGSFMPFLALEWLEGETLEAVAERRRKENSPFTLDELIRLLTPVARALEKAHNFPGPEGPVSIVHRDMKPENIFLAHVAGESVVKILDFGIGKAKSMASQVAGRSSQGDVGLGSFTPAYGAPEQWLPKRYGQTGPWTDVWGLALTMVELLAGRSVIDGDQAAMMGTVVDPERRPTPRTEGVAVGEAVEAVFQRALAVDPRDRYPHAGEFWNALLSAVTADMQRVGSRVARASGRSGAFASPVAPALGRHNIIPDLEPPAAPARAIELDLDEPPPSRRGVEAPPPVAKGSGRYPAVSRGSGSRPSVRLPHESSSGSGDRHPAAGQASAGPPSASRGSGQWALGAPPVEPVPSATPPPVAVSSSLVREPQRDSPRPEPLRVPPGSEPPPETTLLQRLLVPLVLIAAGVLVTWADGLYASSSGKILTIGPIRLAWLAAGLALGGIGLAAYRLLSAGTQG